MDKIVSCLYRVSTKKQVDENDIPMQKNACREFINNTQGWVLGKEYFEKGISGYSKTESQRDVLQEIKKDATNKKFDILLVFMFDRLGRREDETPFIVEWFVKQGIEVWSVQEGRQSFENHVDKLLNYLRFWQSSGESEKTSIRTAESHKQMVLDGLYRGGATPYGYKVVYSGLRNKRDYELKKLIIDEKESEVIKRIFDLVVTFGCGCHKISKILNRENILTKKGSNWTDAGIMTILKNELYKGVYVSRKTTNNKGVRTKNKSDDWLCYDGVLTELVIVSEDIWNKAEKIRNKRNSKEPNVLSQSKTPMLFVGFAKCGCCGSYFTSNYYQRKWSTKNGETKSYLQPVYICKGKKEGVSCDGQKSFSANLVDDVVSEDIRSYLSRIESMDLTDEISRLKNVTANSLESDIKKIEAKIETTKTELMHLKNEIAKCLIGNSSFSKTQLSEIFDLKEKELTALEYEKSSASVGFQNRLDEINDFSKLAKNIPDFIKEFDNAPHEVKKMMVYQIIDEVIIQKGEIFIKYKFDLFNLSKGVTWFGNIKKSS